MEKLIGLVRDGLATLAGLGVIVYLTGGAIVALRLAAARLPTTAVVGQLPRNVLISVGLAEGLAPILIVGAGYMGARSLLYKKGKEQNWPKFHLERMWGQKAQAQELGQMAVHILWTLGATALALTPAIVAAVAQNDSMLHENSGFFWGVTGVIAFITWLVMLLYLNMRARIVERFRCDLTAVRPTLLHSLLVVVALVPPSVAFWSTRPLEHAAACLTRVPDTAAKSPTVSGYLVGETSDHVYIGEIGGDHPSLVSVPSAQVRQVLTGRSASAADCDEANLH